MIMALSLTSFGHKHYISIANLEYNPKLKQVEVSLQLTAHDFEHILETKFNRHIHMEDVKDSSDVDLFIRSYINQHIHLTSGHQKAKLNYVGKEVDVRDQLFFYFTFTKVLDPSHIILQNSILFQLFSKQQNLMHYKFNGITKSVTCTKDLAEGEIKF